MLKIRFTGIGHQDAFFFLKVPLVFLIVISSICIFQPYLSEAKVIDCNKNYYSRTNDQIVKSISGKVMLYVHEKNSGNDFLSIVLIESAAACNSILHTWGESIDFVGDLKKEYPDVEISAKHRKSAELQTNHFTYDRQSNKYLHKDYHKTVEINKRALALLSEDKINEAISLWKSALNVAIIPGRYDTQNAELLNNLGFAYHQLGKKTGEFDAFKSAKEYLSRSQHVDNWRAIVHLNEGDLLFDMEEYLDAVHSYKFFLKLNSEYRFKDKVEEKIKMIYKLSPTVEGYMKLEEKYDLASLNLDIIAENESILNDLYNEVEKTVISFNDKLITISLFNVKYDRLKVFIDHFRPSIIKVASEGKETFVPVWAPTRLDKLYFDPPSASSPWIHLSATCYRCGGSGAVILLDEEHYLEVRDQDK